eukprot:gene38046-49881_t
MRTETHFDGRILSCFAERPASFYAMFAQAVASAPEHEALSCNGERWTYAQVEREVTRIAAGLSMQGLVAGERVLMFISNKPEFVFVLYALQKIGAIAVPVGTREQRPGLTYILNQCGAAGVVFDSELADRIPAADAVPALRLRIAIGATPVAVRNPMANPTITQLAADLAAGRTTSRKLTEEALARIADPKGEGQRAFVKVWKDQALAAAEASDGLRKAGLVPSPLAGIP